MGLARYRTPRQLLFVAMLVVVIGCIVLWNAKHGDNRIHVRGPVTALEFRPDGNALAIMTSFGIGVWSTSERQILHRLPKTWRHFAWSPDGRLIAAIDSTYSIIKIWTPQENKLVASLDANLDVGYGIYNLAWSKDGMLLAAGCIDGIIRVWRMPEGKIFHTFQTNEKVQTAVAFTSDNQSLVTKGASEIILWSLVDKQPQLTIEGRFDIDVLAVSPRGQNLAAGDVNKTIKLYGVHDGNLLHALEGHTDYIRSTAFSPDGHFLASGAQGPYEPGAKPRDTTVRLWRVEDGSLVHTFLGHRHAVSSVAISPDGQTLVSGGYDGVILFWPLGEVVSSEQ